MKSLLCSLGFLTVLFTLGVAGCSRPPVRPEKVVILEPKSSFQAFLDNCAYAENPRAVDDAGRFRGGFDLLTAHFSKPDVIDRMRGLSAKNRKFLETDVGLTEAELTEVEATSFRTADAHYLDECFLLRDAARSLEVNNLSTVKQAHLHFRWVMRNVLLHEQTDTWIPAALILRRGYGSALDRALVFLALLRQSQIEGCLIVVPEPAPQQILVAALDTKTHRLHLFDPRLGLALLSKDGESVLSLTEAIDDPTLLQASQITPDQAKKLEAWLVCPLYALSSRLQELQKRLSDLDTITLYLDAADLAREVAKATKILVKVWNPPLKDNILPNSPTRSLRQFLPKQEGGIDETHRATEAARARMPFQNAIVNYAELNVTKDFLPQVAFQLLQGITQDFFRKYDLQPREMYLRGLYESMIRRQERLQLFVKDDALVGLGKDKAFLNQLKIWRKQLDDARNNTAHEDPAIRARAQKAIEVQMFQDRFVHWLLELNKEEKLERPAPQDGKIIRWDPATDNKTVLTGILAFGMRDYFEFELARAQASANHETAARAQAVLAVLAEQKKPTDAARKQARDGWVNARSSWANFYLDRLALDSMIKRRLQQLNERVLIIEIDQRISLLETLHLDVQKYFHAKLCLAECLEHLQGAKASHDYLLRVKAEIVELKKKGLLQAEVQKLSEALRQIPPAQVRLTFLARDWSDPGSYSWMIQHIERRIGVSKS